MTDTNALLRLINIGFRRFAREPETRAASSRAILNAAVALHSAYTSPGDASLAVVETLATLSAADRRQRRAG